MPPEIKAELSTGVLIVTASRPDKKSALTTICMAHLRMRSRGRMTTTIFGCY